MFKTLLSLPAIIFLSSFPAAAEVVQLTTQNTVSIRGEISSASVQLAKLKLVELIAARGTSTYPLYLVFDSPGGSIDAGEDFIQFAKLVRDLHTITIFGASMASGIVEGLPGRRLVTENASMMFHRAYAQLEGQLNEGELESRLRHIKNIITSMEVRNAARLQMSLADYKSAVKDEYWAYGQEAVDKHMADAVVDLTCTQELIKSKTSVAVQVLFFTLDLEYSDCPLIRDTISTSQKSGEN